MPKIVEVPGVGNVEFPDTMDDDAIGAALSRHTQPPTDPHVPRFRDPDIQTLANAISPHVVAKALPAAGGMIGGSLGAAGGPGAFATVPLGAGLGAALGRALQKRVDLSLGYEKPQSTLQALSDVSATGLENAAYATGAGVLTAGLAKAAPAIASALEGGALATGRRILRNVGGSISKSKPLPDEAVREAFDQGAFRFGGTSGGAAQRLEAAREKVGQQYGQILDELEKQGITGPAAQNMAQQYSARLQTVSANTMNPAVPKVYESAAEQVASKPSIGGRLGLSQTEDLKRSLQGMAKSAYKQMQPSEVGQAHEEAASMMRQAVEDEIAQQAANASPAVQDIAARFVPVKQQAGRIIQASDVANEGAARAANRNAISLPDWIAAAGGLRHGGAVEGAASGLATHLLRSRGPSSAAVLLHGASRLAGAFPSAAPQAQRATIALSPAVAAALNDEMPSAPRLQKLLAGLQQKRSDQLGSNP